MDPEPERTRLRLFAEAFRLWAPIVVSLCAIGLTLFQAAQTRRHARLSVQPRLEWRVETDSAGTLGYSLVNNGFGPAVLTDLTLAVDGTPVGPDGLETCGRIAALLGRSDPARWETHCFDKEGDLVIRAGDRITIFASRAVPGSPATEPPPAREDYLRVTASGRYCSFYDECWPLE